MLFDEFGKVVGLDPTKNFEELMLEKDQRREERKHRRLEERRRRIERGEELTDPDEEIDGLSSVSSIDSDVAGTDMKKVEAF